MSRGAGSPSTPQLILAGALGAGAAILVACGGGAANLIPPQNANQLTTDFDRVASEVAAGNCDAGVGAALAAARRDLAALPTTVDPQLRSTLTTGVQTLTARATNECKPASTTTTPTTPTTSTATTPTQTQSQTTTTQTNTQTTATDTTPTTSTPTTTTPTTPTGGTTTPTDTGTTPGPGGGTPAPSGQSDGRGGNGGGSASGGTPGGGN